MSTSFFTPSITIDDIDKFLDEFKKEVGGLDYTESPKSNSNYPPSNPNFRKLETRGNFELYEHVITKERNWVNRFNIIDEGIESAFYDPSIDPSWNPPKLDDDNEDFFIF